MSAGVSLPGEASHSRAVSIRYFNLYRIVVASAFAIFGGVFSFGQKAPEIFLVTIIAYWVMAFAFFLLHAGSPHYGERSLGLQTALDIVMLSVFMYASGGFRSGVPFLMMTSIAGAGLIGHGRMVLGAASLATLAVLGDQVFRVLTDNDSQVDFSQAAIVCVGFFAVAVVARMLARRALANEALARLRGFDLARQLQVNARIIEDMQDGVVVVDDAGVVRQVNPRAGDLLGVALQTGDRVAERVPELASSVLLEKSPESVQLVAALTGKTLHVRRVMIDEGRDGSDTLLYLEDMDRVQAQAQQIKLAALGRLTANIAHEIRNPLSAVSHAGELLLEEKRQDVQERLVRIIRDNAARIERMVRDVLELGRRDRLTVESLDAAQFCRSFVDEFSIPAPQVAQLVRLELEEHVMLNFDRVHLYQILANLLGNASRYCSGTPGSICLSARAQDERRVLIAIRDDGPGIAIEDRAKVFEPFFTSDPKGTGLGLFMARELADANGAELSLLEAPGGAEFHLIARRTA
ncbi:HAMP domain-containing sensor histidine kinase [Uliginosibacterium sp. 31-16]|uniref:sensor histidine kinase n=1 Tax=Uliginosibacterium sp. 31-16 TaxID=3068315 RepID=UPI002740260A|nr:HAMP domain-containing sensor histidine kinase [Uliginosibacterium sp. 31-16]MDP5240192.1 HAMP domain-containing sensor histidine kinase [Uliginosibacterium sp. 31-16]